MVCPALLVVIQRKGPGIGEIALAMRNSLQRADRLSMRQHDGELNKEIYSYGGEIYAISSIFYKQS